MRIFISPEDFTFIRSLRSPELIFELRWWGAAVRTAAIFETKPDQKREREKERKKGRGGTPWVGKKVMQITPIFNRFPRRNTKFLVRDISS